MIKSISEVEIGQAYDRDELFALCDWFADCPGVLFGSVCESSCFRAEPSDAKWIVKEVWEGKNE
jgi:hypothetical protein